MMHLSSFLKCQRHFPLRLISVMVHVWPSVPQAARLICHGDSPGKNTGVGCQALLQGVFPTQESNLHLLSPALADRFFTIRAGWEALMCDRSYEKWTPGLQPAISYLMELHTPRKLRRLRMTSSGYDWPQTQLLHIHPFPYNSTSVGL